MHACMHACAHTHMHICTEGEAKYKQFLNQRKLPWCGEVPTVGFETRVKHTISIFVAAHQKLRKHNRNM